MLGSLLASRPFRVFVVTNKNAKNSQWILLNYTCSSEVEVAMAYDPEKDKILKKWKCNETGLVVSINQYGDGEPKVQIGPRILSKKDGSERAPVKAGRLTIEDLMWLYDIIDEVKDDLAAFHKPQ